MTYFSLTLLKALGEGNPKVHKISFETFRKAYRDFPRAEAERLVELGYAKWAPCNVHGKIITPQSMLHPMQFFLISLPTHSVKAIHINDLVPENGPTPRNPVLFAQNLIKDVWYVHDVADEVDPDEYDKECECYDTECAVDLVYDVVEPVADEPPDEGPKGQVDEAPVDEPKVKKPKVKK